MYIRYLYLSYTVYTYEYTYRNCTSTYGNSCTETYLITETVPVHTIIYILYVVRSMCTIITRRVLYDTRQDFTSIEINM